MADEVAHAIIDLEGLDMFPLFWQSLRLVFFKSWQSSRNAPAKMC